MSPNPSGSSGLHTVLGKSRLFCSICMQASVELCSEELQEGSQQAWHRSCTFECNVFIVYGWAVREIQDYKYTCQGKILAMNFLTGNKMEIEHLTVS